MTLDGEPKKKVIDSEKLWNFIVDNFFYSFEQKQHFNF